MKKFFIAVVLFFSAMMANAQLSPYREFSVFDGNHYWFEAGAAYSKITARHADYKLGFKAGFGADIPFAYSWVSFLPSAVFESKGFKSNMMKDMAMMETDMMSMYVELPLDFSLNIPLGKRFGLQICAGPYVAYGVAGSYTESSDNYIGLYGMRTLEHKAFFNKGEDADKTNRLKNFDLGADLNLRFIILRYGVLKVGAEFGFLDANAIETEPGFRTLSFSAGLAFRY